MQTKDWKTAESLFEDLDRADYGETGVVETYLAQIAEETGRYQLAYERYLAVPESERGWLAKLRAAAMLGKMKRVDEARRFLADLPAVTQEQRIQVRQAEAQLLRDAGDARAAFAVLEQALVEHPDDPDLLYDSAMVAEKLDRLDVVETRLTRLIEQKPDNAQALNSLGYTLVDRTPRVAEGFALIERAHKLSPGIRSSSTAWAGRTSGWAGSTQPRSTCAARSPSAPTRRSLRTWARCSGPRATGSGRRRCGSRSSTRRPTARCCRTRCGA